MESPTPRAVTAALLAALGAACDGSAATLGPAASSGATAPSATAEASAAPPRDDTPPPWAPDPRYTEIPWERAERLLLLREVARVTTTTRRRVYLASSDGRLYFTIEPRSGAVKRLVAGAPRDAFLLSFDNEEVSPQEADALLLGGRVRSAFLAHFGLLWLRLKNYRTLLVVGTIGVSFDEVKKKYPTFDVTVE